MKVAVWCGIGLGLLYTLSPLTVLSIAAITALASWMAREMTPRERRWFLGLLTLGVVLRLAAIGALFVLADPGRPFGMFFGDEELFKNRTIWLRNVFLGVPIAPADMIYVFDEVGRSSFLYLLAYLQALVGDAPYGLNVANVCWYAIAVLVLHRLVRRALGAPTALGGMALLLFLPSLFSWSISVLKEPLYILLGAIELVCAVQIIRGRSWWIRIAGVAGVVACAYALESVRVGGFLLATVGAAAGVIAAVALSHPRRATLAVLAAPVLLLLVWVQPSLQQRGLRLVQHAAFQHTGHVVTPGYSYELLDPRLYSMTRLTVYDMTIPQAARFVLRALWNFVTVPRPSQIHSTTALAYLPEHAVWYALLMLLPFGAVAAFRREPVLTCLLLSHGFAAAMMVALTGGNIGTLIRHRGLTLPYICWFAPLGLAYLTDWLASHQPVSARATLSPGEQA